MLLNADGASACGSLSDLHQWFVLLHFRGSLILVLYVVNPAKCYLNATDSCRFEFLSSLDFSVLCNHCYQWSFYW